MNGVRMSISPKDLGKAAVVVGFGFTVGKTLGEYADVLLNSVVGELWKRSAQKGNVTAQEFCKKANLDYETKPEDDNSSGMGFHCE